MSQDVGVAFFKVSAGESPVALGGTLQQQLGGISSCGPLLDPRPQARPVHDNLLKTGEMWQKSLIRWIARVSTE